MKMLKLPLVSSRENGPFLFSDERVDKISSQVKLSSLQKESSVLTRLGRSHVTVASAVWTLSGSFG